MWTRSDREKWRAWRLEQTERCPRCNTFEWETDRNHPDFQGKKWQAGVNRCEGCVELDIVLEAEGKKPHRYGESVRLYGN